MDGRGRDWFSSISCQGSTRLYKTSALSESDLTLSASTTPATKIGSPTVALVSRRGPPTGPNYEYFTVGHR